VSTGIQFPIHATRCLETSVTADQWTWRNILDGLNLQHSQSADFFLNTLIWINASNKSCSSC